MIGTDGVALSIQPGVSVTKLGTAGSATLGVILDHATTGTLKVRDVTNANDAALTASTITVGGSAVTITAVNAVSPSSPNRTVTITFGGTTYYLAAKTTND